MNFRRGRIFRIVGVPGSGKTTIAEQIVFPEAPAPFKAVDAKKILCELAGVPDEKTYRTLPEAARRVLLPRLVEIIRETACDTPEHVWFFERHLCSMNEDGTIITRGIPQEHGSLTIGVAVVVAGAVDIAIRRQGDKTVRHDRHMLEAAQIAEEQRKEIQLAREAGDYWSFPVRIFQNPPGKSAETVAGIMAFMRELVIG